MEKLTKEQRESLKKLNTDRLRARLVKLGVDEELAFTSERDDLLNMLAELMLLKNNTQNTTMLILKIKHFK